MASKAPEHLQERLDALPTKPGVYLMKDTSDDVIYVGCDDGCLYALEAE